MRSNMWLVARREFVERGRSSAYLITTILMAAVLLLSTLAPMILQKKSESKPIQVLLLDQTGQVAGPLKAALEAINKTPGARQITLETVTGDEQSLKDQILHTEKALLVLEGTFPDALKARYLAGSPSTMSASGAVVGPLESLVRAARMQAKGIDTKTAAELLQPLQVETAQVTSNGGQRDENAFVGSMLLAMGFTMVLYFVILMNGQFVFTGVLEEKISRVMEVMAAAVGPSQMLTGKILGLGGLGLIQFVVMILAWFGGHTIGNKMTGIPSVGVRPFTALAALAFLILGYLVSASLMAAAASTISRMEDQQTVAMPITMLLVIPMLFMTFSVNNPDSTFVVVLSMVPFFSQAVMVFRMMMSDVPLWQMAVSLLLMAGTAVLSTWAGGRIYRAAMLSYGGRPTLKQVWSYLKAG